MKANLNQTVVIYKRDFANQEIWNDLVRFLPNPQNVDEVTVMVTEYEEACSKE